MRLEDIKDAMQALKLSRRPLCQNQYLRIPIKAVKRGLFALPLKTARKQHNQHVHSTIRLAVSARQRFNLPTDCTWLYMSDDVS